MNVVDTLYQILTGVSPPSGITGITVKTDSVVIMQALIHRPKEQIFETLNVICELLPAVHRENLTYLDDIYDAGYSGDIDVSMATRSKKSPNDKRLELLESCQEELKRFTVILLPTLTDAYSSTVNLSVRQKVLTAQLKMLSNVKVEILAEALRPVPYASYLASILSQQDHPTLVTYALQAAELLLKRLESIYRYQFYREGVIFEISKMAERTVKHGEKSKGEKSVKKESKSPTNEISSSLRDASLDREQDKGREEDDEEPFNDDHPSEEGDEEREEEIREENASPSSSDLEEHAVITPLPPKTEDVIVIRARKFMENHEDGANVEMKAKSTKILDDLKKLAYRIRSQYLEEGAEDGRGLFEELANYFGGDAVDSITSNELLTSDIVSTLLDVFSSIHQGSADARSAFLEVFMSSTLQLKGNAASTEPTLTPFSVLIAKLQDLLSRAEHFEVVTVHQNSFDSNRGSAASMLAKQIRLKLVADDDSGIPKPYRNIMVSIHAIATFKALDDYLRPRINLSEKPRAERLRDMSGAMAAYAAAMSGRGDLTSRLAERRPVAVPADDASSKLSTKQVPKPKSSPPKSAVLPTNSASDGSAGLRRSSRRHQKSQPVKQTLPPLWSHHRRRLLVRLEID